MSNLLEKASILTTPTAYDDGKILSVKPNTSVGDFDFTRNSSATRVNSQGLIEDMQILSGDLVSNGDFATDSDWSLGTGWSIGVDKLVGSNADTSTYQGVGIQVNKSYKIQFTVIDYVSGSVRPLLNGLPNVDGTNVNSNGTYTQYLQSNSGSNGNFTIRGNSFVGSIDNVSVIEIIDDTNLPRIDYTDGVGSWLFEPQSTNRMTTSEPISGGVGFTFPAKTWANGLINGLNATEASSGTKYWYMSSGIANEYSTFSFFVEMEDGSEPIIGGNNDANSDFVIMVKGYFMQESNIKKTNTIGNVWKIEATSRVNELANSSQIGILKYGTQSNKTFSATGFQIEQSSFATSYIPTNGSTVTRLQDAAFGAGSSDLINSTEGVLYAEIAALANGGVGDRYISLGSGSDVTNTVQLLYHNTANRINFRVTKGSSFQVNISDFTFEQTENLKIAVKFKANDFALWINGVERATDTSGQTFDVGTLQKLQFDSGNRASDFFGKVKSVAVFKEALTDAELTCLTTI